MDSGDDNESNTSSPKMSPANNRRLKPGHSSGVHKPYLKPLRRPYNYRGQVKHETKL